jgi:hypothetical protein
MLLTANPAEVAGLTVLEFGQYMLRLGVDFTNQYVDIWKPDSFSWVTHEVLKFSPPGVYSRIDSESGKQSSYKTLVPVFDVVDAATGDLLDLDPCGTLVRPTVLPSNFVRSPLEVPRAYALPGNERFLPPHLVGQPVQALGYTHIRERLDQSSAALQHLGTALSQPAFSNPETVQTHPGAHLVHCLMSQIPNGMPGADAVDSLRRRLLLCCTVALLEGGDNTRSRLAHEMATQLEETAMDSLAEKAAAEAARRLSAAKAGQTTLPFALERRQTPFLEEAGSELGFASSERQMAAATEWAVQQLLPLRSVLAAGVADFPVVLRMPFKFKGKTLRRLADLFAVIAPPKPQGTKRLPGGVYSMFYRRLGVLLDLLYQLVLQLWQRTSKDVDGEGTMPSSTSLRCYAFADQGSFVTGPKRKDLVEQFCKLFESWVQPLKSPSLASNAVQQQVQGYAHRLDMLRREQAGDMELSQ